MPNRLALEASPYLLQHAHNPVDWFPWGPEALAKAKAEDKPILLSIGYSACHWCHVMERESFENEATARLMNRRFVNVKVDREERPDLDQIYQLVVQVLGRSGGWPLTVFLTPDQKPFFGGTYFPPAPRYGMPGFPQVLEALADAYLTQKGEVAEQSEKITRAITAAVARASSPRAESGVDAPGAKSPRTSLGASLFEAPASNLLATSDQEHGGFGSRPKFPNTMALDVLLRRGHHDDDRAAKAAVRRALDGMASGGIHDQLGGGFHRYSTDEEWLVPHFEKMLYDQALLVRLYADGARALAEPRYRAVASGIIRYLGREMVSPDGALYASQDADSEGEEGKFFVWTRAELEAALDGDREALDAAVAAFGITGEGNFEGTSAHVLFDARAGEPETDREPSRDALARATERLFRLRETRPKPFRDEKILASWNALAIWGLAEAGMAFGGPSGPGDEGALSMAIRAYDFIVRELTGIARGDGAVLRLVKGGVKRGPGFLEDHAWLARAALGLYEATGEPRYVGDATKYVASIRVRFLGNDGTFRFTPSEGEALLVRPADPFDQAVPNGGAVACEVLLRLGTLLGGDFAEVAERVLLGLVDAATKQPMGFGETWSALDRLVRGSVDVVIVGKPGEPAAEALARVVFRRYVPNRQMAWLDPDDAASVGACRALAGGKVRVSGVPTAYVCRGRSCSLPVTTPEELEALLA